MADKTGFLGKLRSHIYKSLLAAASAALVACGGDDGAAGPSAGTLRLAITDAPACGYDRVYVTVNKIRVHQSATATGAIGEGGWSELVLPAQRIDLLSLTNGVLQELGSMPLPVGAYQQIRLVLADNPLIPAFTDPLANSVVLSSTNGEVALTTPSGQQSGFKLKANFNIEAGQVADLVLDFDACKSIVRAGNSGIYKLKPVVSVIKRVATEIQGYVDPAIASTVVVSTRDPDNNLRSTIPDPQTGRFRLAYLPEGTNYTVVLAGQNVTTAAITGVPVSLSTSVTQLNGAANPISPPASATATLSGVVRNGSNALLTDATVSARQTLGSGEVLDVVTRVTDPDTASYTMTLPTAAPLRAAYVTGGTLTFVTDPTVVAGLYKIYGTAPGYTGQSTSPEVNLTPGANVIKDLVLTP